MTPVRSFLTAIVAVALLLSTLPIAGIEQYPHGLMSVTPTGGGQGGACIIETRPLSFGNYDPLAGTDVDAVGQVIYSCQVNEGNGGGGGNGPGTLAQNKGIRIEMDQGGGHSFDPRAMVGPGGDDLEYNIYLDATHRTVWGTGVHTTEVYVDLHPPNRTPTTVLAYGRIFGGQDPTAGNYVDSVAVRIQF
jgi:spore coat protein U-like protein